MQTSIKRELSAHLIDLINGGVLTSDNVEDWHYHAFNEDYYIVGYYEAEQWLERHHIDAFDAINTCLEYEKNTFGEVTKSYDNAEITVNMLAYIYGEELINSIGAESIEELDEALTI